MNVEASIDSFADVAKAVEGEIADAAIGAMRDTTPDTARELREQVSSNGLSQRLANAWRGKVYPNDRVDPAGFVWSRAPEIIDAFIRGATIVPVNGGTYLAIPSDNVPMALGARGTRRRMTPVEVEAAFDQEMFLKRGRDGHLLLFISAVASRSGKGWRRGTPGRLASGRNVKPVLMFTLVKTVTMPKLLDVDGPADRWAERFAAAFERRLGGGQ